jgi:hypothetical protein
MIRRATDAKYMSASECRCLGARGETPGFVYRHHLEEVIGHGEPRTSLLRRILLG